MKIKLLLLKRDHHGGQSIYGVYENETLATKAVKELGKIYPQIPLYEYYTEDVVLNKFVEIE